MKTHAIKKILFLALALICLCASASQALSQETSNSTRTDDAKRAALLSALERAQDEVAAGRKYIDALRAQVKSKQDLIEKLTERDAAREQVEKSLQKEVGELRAAIDEQKKTLQIKSDEVEYLKKELSKANKKLRAAHSREKFLVGAVGGLLLFVLLHR